MRDRAVTTSKPRWRLPPRELERDYPDERLEQLVRASGEKETA